MKLETIELKNYRGMTDIKLPLSDGQVTLIAGMNGVGKSTVMDAAAIMLSWILARVRHAGTSGRTISEKDIHNHANDAQIRIVTTDGESWTLSKTRKGHIRKVAASDLKFVSSYALSLQEKISSHNEHCSIPIFAYYPVNRTVLDIPVRIRKKHEFSLLEAYDNSLISAADFRRFFEWFRSREDLENERFREFVGTDKCPFDSQLQAVRHALESFMPQFKNIRIQRSPLAMVVEKNGERVQVEQLSDGEKCMLAMVGDLAKRLAIANPTKSNPLEGEGIVLIDELDLHLHPQWQRLALHQLTKIFPNCQFLISTHSPQIMGEAQAKSLRILKQDSEGNISFFIPKQSLGLTSAEVLEELLDTPRRNIEITKALDAIYLDIDNEEFESAHAAISALRDRLKGDIPELIRAESILCMLEDEA
ncbi:MAG: AAA family ATPase [Oceanisphaera sp.]